MSLLIKIVVALVIIAFVAVAVLRVRKLRRDELRELSRPVERRLMTPPPSPYEPSKGFRLLDGSVDQQRRPEPPRPRLDAGHEYVFSESQLGSGEELRSGTNRHDERWALSRSSHHSTIPSFGLRAVAIIVALGLVAAFAFYYVNRGPSTKGTTTTSTTLHSSTTRPSTSTTKPSTAKHSLAGLSVRSTPRWATPYVGGDVSASRSAIS
jgi:hypothetical protein